MDRTDTLGMMAKPARLLLALVPIVIMSVGFPATASAEPITCLPDQKGCGEAAIEKKVQTSFNRAAYAFVGQLESIQDSKSGISTTRIFTFRLEKRLKGALAGKVARVSIDSYLTGGKKTGTNPPRSLAEFEQMEAVAESVDTEEAKNEYLQRVGLLREAIKKNGAAEASPTHVVRLNLTAGDGFIRSTDIPMRIGERYAVLVFSKVAFASDPKQDTGNISSWTLDPVDLYSMNGERGKRALAALVQATKSKRN